MAHGNFIGTGSTGTNVLGNLQDESSTDPIDTPSFSPNGAPDRVPVFHENLRHSRPTACCRCRSSSSCWPQVICFREETQLLSRWFSRISLRFGGAAHPRYVDAFEGARGRCCRAAPILAPTIDMKCDEPCNPSQSETGVPHSKALSRPPFRRVKNGSHLNC